MIKAARRGGKAVDVRRLHERVTITSERRAQIVHGDEEDVWAGSAPCSEVMEMTTIAARIPKNVFMVQISIKVVTCFIAGLIGDASIVRAS